MSENQEPAGFDLDEDLFDFAAAAPEPEASAESEEDLEEIFASFRDTVPEEELLRVPPAPAAPRPARSAPQPEPPAALPHERPRRAAEPEQSELEQLEGLEQLEAPEPAPPLPARRGFPKTALAIALAITVLNSGLAMVMLHGRRAGSQASAERPAPSAEERAEPEHGDGDVNAAHAAPPGALDPRALPDPESRAPLHSHPALDQAREEIAHGEYAAARQRVYGLLAIIDRLDDPRRGELEADCQFLIAQALHLEALARMGGPQ